MKLKKRKMASAKDASASSVPSANSVESVPLSVKAKLRGAKKGVKEAKGSSVEEVPSAKSPEAPKLKGANTEYIKRLKRRLSSKK